MNGVIYTNEWYSQILEDNTILVQIGLTIFVIKYVCKIRNKLIY